MVPLLITALVWGIPIWIAAKAKPLGTHPFRWATFQAALLAITGVYFLYETLCAVFHRRWGPGVIFLLQSVLILLATNGLFRRMRSGAISIIAAEILLPLAAPLAYALSRAANPTWQASGSFGPLVFVIVNLVYFKKRWKQMEPGLYYPIVRPVNEPA